MRMGFCASALAVYVCAALTLPAAAKTDLSGLWLTPMGYGIPNADGTPFAGRPPVPVTMPPMLPWVKKIHDDEVRMMAEGEPDQLKFSGTAHRCLPFGTPSDMMQPYPLQIVQRDDAVLIVFEANHQFRVIPIGAAPPAKVAPTYRGVSTGRWEGDVLVVETSGFNDKTIIMSAGAHEATRLSWFRHSDQLRVTERLSRSADGNTLNYAVTIDDPGGFSAPWGFRETFALRNDLRLNEYVCAENNADAAASALH
jgi:hypothetical protein